MALIAHPLTQLNGSPQYTADNYRKAVNALLTPSDGTAFGTVSGVRAGSPSPLLSISGTTVTVKPHAGVICPWTGVGAYTYVLDAQATVNVADSTGTYKIALVLSDPSQSHGSTPGILLQSFPASTADSAINGLVLGQVASGTANDTAPRILQQTIISVLNLATLNAFGASEGQRALVTSDGTVANNTEYVYRGGVWVRVGNLPVLASKVYAGWDLTAVASGRVVEIRMNSNGAASTSNSGVLVGSVGTAFAPSTRVIALLQTAVDGAQLRARVEPSGQIYIDHQGVSGNKNWYISGGLVYLAV